MIYSNETSLSVCTFLINSFFIEKTNPILHIAKKIFL